jgi:hypothetical protein
MHVEAVIVNKVHLAAGHRPATAGPRRAQSHPEAGLSPVRIDRLAGRMAEALGDPAFRPTAEKLIRNLAHHEVLAEMDARNIDALREPVGKHADFVEVPLLPIDVHDFEGLQRMNDHLFQARAA